jgi:F-type H+-transporting ATPase subunit b
MVLADAGPQAGLLDLDLSLVVEVVLFVAMIAVLAKWVYPRIGAAAEARQRAIKEQMDAAERARQQAERALRDVDRHLEEARAEAARLVDEAGRVGERRRGELRARADAEARRMTQEALGEIEDERRRLSASARADAEELVATAAEKVIGQPLDPARRRPLVETALREVGASDGSVAQR